MWEPSQANKLQDIMEEHPNILYVTRILKNVPELGRQFIPVDPPNYDSTQNIKNNLSTLVGNMEPDVPDGIGDFKSITATDKARNSALKVLVLFSRSEPEAPDGATRGKTIHAGACIAISWT